MEHDGTCPPAIARRTDEMLRIAEAAIQTPRK
jgi:hypothetical protein